MACAGCVRWSRRWRRARGGRGEPGGDGHGAGPCGRAGPGPAACGAGGSRADGGLQAWGVWAESVRERAEQRLGVTDLEDPRVRCDPEYAQALDAGGCSRRRGPRPRRRCALVRAGNGNRFTPFLIAPRLGRSEPSARIEGSACPPAGLVPGMSFPGRPVEMLPEQVQAAGAGAAGRDDRQARDSARVRRRYRGRTVPGTGSSKITASHRAPGAVDLPVI